MQISYGGGLLNVFALAQTILSVTVHSSFFLFFAPADFAISSTYKNNYGY